MYRPSDGGRLSECHASEGSLGPYRQGSSLTKRVLGDSSWSFGGVHSTVAEHLHQKSSVQQEELQSTGIFVSKQNYVTPPQRRLRGQHGTPITISSDGSLILGDYTTIRPTLKRAGSPSMIYQTKTKRQQLYDSPGMMQPLEPAIDDFPNDSRHLYLEEQSQAFESRHINEEQLYQQYIPGQLSQSSYGRSPQARILHERLIQRQPASHPQCVSSHRDAARRLLASHHLSPRIQFRNRSPTRAPVVVQDQSPKQHWSSLHNLQQVSNYEQESVHPQGHAQHRQYDQYGLVDPSQREQFMPAMTFGRESQLKLQTENSCQTPLRIEGSKQQTRLGSPLWPNAKAPQTDVQCALEIRVQGYNVVPAGSTKIPEDQIDHRHISEIPFTPSRQRAKSPDVSSQSPLKIHRGRNNILAPISAICKDSKALSQKTLYQAPSVENVPDDDCSESTPLNEVLRRQQRQGQTIASNFEKCSYKIANILPQENILSHYRPKTAEAKLASPQYPLKLPPEVLSPISTPEANTASPDRQEIRSIPMKERIKPAKKPPTKKSVVTSKKTATRPKESTPKTPKANKKQKKKMVTDDPDEPAIVMQKRAADLIINKEIQGAAEAMDLDLFGEVVGMTEEEEARKKEEMRAKAQRKLIDKAAELQAKEEAEQLVEMERMRVKAEKKEKESLEKEVEQERAKARREADRKKQEALEERERDELRRKTAERIEADRKKAAEETERREKLQREAKEWAEKVQAEAKELSKLKTKQEEAKKQAASLHVAKISMSEDAEKADGVNIGKDVEVLMEEDSLFIPENGLDSPKTDNGSRVKSFGPTNAAQVFAQSDAKAKISRYRAEKEETELQRQKWMKETRLSERWKRKDAKKAMQQAPPPESLKESRKPSKAAKEELPKSKPQAVMSPPISEVASATESKVSQPIVPSFIGSANSSLGNDKSAPAALPPPKSQVKLISQLELERIEKEAHAKQAKDITAQRAKRRTEEQKAERRKNEVEKTRAKQRQKLIDEAKQNGWERLENEIEAQVEAHMTKLEVQRQRRRERSALKQSIHDFAPDDLALEAFMGFRSHFSEITDSHASTIDDEEEFTLEEQLRRANEVAMKESMKALARQRNSSFARAAAKKTVADFQTDSESEEDPDPAPAKLSEKDNTAKQDSDADSETDDDDRASAVNGANPDEHDNQIVPLLPDMTFAFEPLCQIKKQQPETSSAVRNLINNPSVSEHLPVMLYTVKKEITFNGRKKNEPPILSQSFSRKEANDIAAAEVQKLRQRPTKSISEGYNDDDLFFATINYERGDKMQTYVYVTACPVSSSEMVDFDPGKVENRLPEKSWFIIQYITERKTNKKTGEIHIHHSVPELLGHFSQLEMANHEACARLIALTKPKNPTLDHIEQHANELAPRIREARDKATEDRVAFEVEIDRDGVQLQWVSFDSVRMEVKLFPMKGPRN